MLNIYQLFTANGLTQALQEHHKRLHTEYNFPPLSGQKPVHKFAENFGFANAEPFTAKLDAMTSRMLSTSVNLTTQDADALVHVEVELGEEQIRCLLDNEAAFVMCTIDVTKLAPAIVTYHDRGNATVFIGAYAINVNIAGLHVTASVFEAEGMNSINTHTPPSENAVFELIDTQTHVIDKQVYSASVQAHQDSIIPATVVSDDGNVVIAFDAVSYFESELKNGNIKTVFETLDGCDFDADYPTDTIAEFYCDGVTEPLFDYLAIVNKQRTIGYRCTVSKSATVSWLLGNGLADLRFRK